MNALLKRCCILLCSLTFFVHSAPTHLVNEAPVSILQHKSGTKIVDFGRVSFGNIKLLPTANNKKSVIVHFGEAFENGRINRKPPGTVRYTRAKIDLDGKSSVVAAPRANGRNTKTNHPKNPPAILTPKEWGVIVPFRWVEIEGWEGELLPEHIIRQSAYASDWNDDASHFESSDELLNKIWDLSRYSIKATTFAGVYVDGDRERIPYEADAYLNQLSHYTTDNDIQMARDTFSHLMQHGTWPSEWAPHMVFMAYADWMHTGDVKWLASVYESLKDKLLLERLGESGLIHSDNRQQKRTDIVDWPKRERDGYVFTSVNTVVNAFHLRAMDYMIAMARATNNDSDAIKFEKQANASRAAFQKHVFSSTSGLYTDGANTQHSSLHANLFPLAFGLVPHENNKRVVDWMKTRGMACSVYAAQYLLEGLFENNAGSTALQLISASGDRSWRHMVESGATITWEAWDMKYKPNQDWNHAWGAAPANLLPRYVLGAQPLVAGWKTARIRPSIGELTNAKGKVPTPKGPISIAWSTSHDKSQGKTKSFSMSLTLPEGMTAKVELPSQASQNSDNLHKTDKLNATITVDGKPVAARLINNYWVIDEEVSGTITLAVK